MEPDTSKAPGAPLHPGWGLHGVLRYRRESPESTTTVQTKSLEDTSTCCEFCGSEVKTPLGHAQESGDFCCVQYKQMCEEMEKEKRLVLGLSEDGPGGPAQGCDIHEGTEEGWNGKNLEWDSELLRLHQREVERCYREATAKLSSENSSLQSKTIRFQLSNWAANDENWLVKYDYSESEAPDPKAWYRQITPDSAKFGLSHQQDSAGFVQKFYSNGKKFLTGFPDGSAQVFYPSGNLAFLVAVHQGEKVCIVHDDVAAHFPIRALFHSSGRATCYHGNGSIWLSMDMWGGRNLNEGGARTRKWSWSDHAHTPTPLRPVFLSLNKNVGVRVLGRHSIYVSFLALGQQVRFSVGSCVQPKDYNTCPPEPPLQTEELLLLVYQLHLQLHFARSRWCLRFPSSTEPRRMKPPSGLRALARKLLKISQSVNMGAAERSFVQRCLQDCQCP